MWWLSRSFYYPNFFSLNIDKYKIKRRDYKKYGLLALVHWLVGCLVTGESNALIFTGLFQHTNVSVTTGEMRDKNSFSFVQNCQLLHAWCLVKRLYNWHLMHALQTILLMNRKNAKKNIIFVCIERTSSAGETTISKWSSFKKLKNYFVESWSTCPCEWTYRKNFWGKKNMNFTNKIINHLLRCSDLEQC